MKKLLFATALAVGACLGLHELTFSHGGTYRGPGDTVPPGGGGGGGGGGPATPGPSGPSTPGPGGPATPGAAGPATPGGGPGAPTGAVTQGGGDGGADLTAWTFWWEFNKEPYLNLKAAIHTTGTQTGSDSFFLGADQKTQGKDIHRPSEETIRQKVVPALLKALEGETNNDIVTGSLIALAKIGDAKDESGTSKFEQVILPKLKDKNQEISETAAVSLGILANESSIRTLTDLLKDNAAGRELVGKGEVDLRTRAFAAYGLSLIGARAGAEKNREEIVRELVEMLLNDKSSQRDVKVACLVALGLVPLASIHAEGGTPPSGEKDPAPAPHTSRIGQLEFLLEYFANQDNHYLVRAHAPTALARMMPGLPAEEHQIYRERIAEALLAGFDKRSKEPAEVIQSCVLALGQLGDNDADPLDEKIRAALISVVKDQSDLQARNYSLIALAQVGGRQGTGEAPKKDEVTAHLIATLTKGAKSQQPWAGVAIGVFGRPFVNAGLPPPKDAALALRTQLAEEKSATILAAYAIGAGILKDADAKAVLLEKLKSTSEEEARGYISVALGLMGGREAVEPISAIIKESKYKPDLLKQAAVALGMLGDKELVPELVKMLQEATALATQAAIASALGTIGDARSIDSLVAMLENKDLTEGARGFAAVALGIVADKEALPWNSKISVDLNYRASTATLNDTEGTGILNIL
jgi:HEAT repeat protein